MYDSCKDCENLGQCRSMMNMPMMNMPMGNMPMMNTPMMDMPMMNMPMMNMSMMNMHMMHMMHMMNMNMPMCEEDEENDEDLKSMYPKVYIRLHPMVKHHYDIMVSKHGKMHCPSREELDCICKEIADKYKECHRSSEEDEVYDDCDNDNMRQRGRGGFGGIQDIAKILLIGNLLGGRNNFFY